jgi:D-arabinose 1-dehydrogenase-like Zn-dependent alcohol dehydrogenase
MKARILHRFGEPLRMETMIDPETEPREALVQVRACGVCGTDLKISSGVMAGVPLAHHCCNFAHNSISKRLVETLS